MSSIHEQLKTLKTTSTLTPRASWVASTRTILRDTSKATGNSMSTVERSQIEKALSWVDMFVPRVLMVNARRVIVGLLVVGLTTYGWSVSVSASQDSLPGDILYGVKLAHEKKELLLVGSQQEKVAVLLNHASKRAQELEKIQKTTAAPVKKEEQVKVVVESLKEKINSTNEELEKIKTDKMVDGVTLAAVVEEKTEKISQHLAATLTTADEVPTTTNTVAVAAALDLEKDVAEVAILIDETNVHAVTAAVQSVTNQVEVAPVVTQTPDTASTTPALDVPVEQTLVKTAERLTADFADIGYDLTIAVSSSLFTSAPSTTKNNADSSTTSANIPTSSHNDQSEVATGTTASTTNASIAPVQSLIVKPQIASDTPQNTPSASAPSVAPNVGSNTPPAIPGIILKPSEPAVSRVTQEDLVTIRQKTEAATTLLTDVKAQIAAKNWSQALQKIQDVYTIKKEIQTSVTSMKKILLTEVPDVAPLVPASSTTTSGTPTTTVVPAPTTSSTDAGSGDSSVENKE